MELVLVIHRTTYEIRRNVTAASYDPAEWLINPDLSGVQGVPDYYWKVVGDSVVEMDAAEKAAVDAARLQKVKEVCLAKLSKDLNDFVESRYDIGAKISILSLYLMAKEYVPPKINRANYLKQALAWGESVIAYFAAKAGAIMAAPDIASVEAVTWDCEADLGPSDPLVRLPVAMNIPD